MGAFNLKRIVVMLMVVSMSTVFAVGCGDGKAKKRSLLNRQADPTAMVDGKPDTDGNGIADEVEIADGSAVDADGDGKPDVKAEGETLGGEGLEQKAADLQKIEESLKALTDGGTAVDKNGLEDGTYKLTSVVSAVRYMLNKEDAMEAKDVRMMQSLELVESGDGKVKLNETSIDKVGMIEDHQIAARALEVALSFEVAKESGEFKAERSSFSAVVLNTSVTNALQATTSLAESSADASPVGVSIIDMMKNSASSDMTYSMEDENKRTVIMRLKKISDTELRIVISVEESKMTDEDANSALIAREIILTYSIAKKEAAAGSDVVLTQPEELATSPATESGTSPSAQDNGEGDDDLARVK